LTVKWTGQSSELGESLPDLPVVPISIGASVAED
jgi:hypothetical protein